MAEPDHDESGQEEEELQRKIIDGAAKVLRESMPMYLEEIKRSMETMWETKLSDVCSSIREELAQNKGKKRVSYKEFLICQPPVFTGDIDPLASQRWVREIEAAFERCGCEEEQKVTFATGQLKDRAKDWWDSENQAMTEEARQGYTWVKLKESFLKHHSPRSAIQQLQDRFLNLRQHEEKVDVVTGVFLDLSKFCPELVRTEEMKMARYLSILRADIREFVSMTVHPSLSEMIEAARRRENELLRRLEKREMTSHDKVGSPTKKMKLSVGKKFDSGRRFEMGKKGGEQGLMAKCKTCAKYHSGKCYFGDPTCFNCGKPGHMISQCPSPLMMCYHCSKPGHKKSDCPELKRGEVGKPKGQSDAPRARGRAFQMTLDELKAEPGLVTGREEKGRSTNREDSRQGGDLKLKGINIG